MLEENDLPPTEPLHALVEILDGSRQLLLSLAAREAEPGETEGEEPETGTALLAELRCVVEDTLSPAIRRLEALIGEWEPG